MNKHHPAAEIFPMMDPLSFDQLTDNIKSNGLLCPIVTLEDMVLDGRNRLKACQKLGIEPLFETFKADMDPQDFVVSVNLHRRHLSQSQKAASAVLYKEQVSRSLKRAPHHAVKGTRVPQASQRAGLQFGVGMTSVDRACTIYRKDRALFDKVQNGELSVERAYRAVMGRLIESKAGERFKPPTSAQGDQEAVQVIKEMVRDGWALQLLANQEDYKAFFYGNGVASMLSMNNLKSHRSFKLAILAAANDAYNRQFEN